MAAPLLLIISLGRYVPPSAGEVIPITIEEQAPCIRVRILGDGATSAPPAKLEFDTGKTGALTLEQIRERFRKAGQAYALELRRGEATIRAAIRTRQLL